MFTITDILQDINRGCLANNMIEDCFSYRIIYFVNENSKGEKHYIDAPYSGLRKSLENIIRNHLSLTNNVVVVQTTAIKDKECVCLQSRPYPFSLDGYFRQINGEYENSNRKGNAMYKRYAAR